MKYIILEEIDSTNSYVSRHGEELDDMTMVAAHSQTAGRGQRGNSWESEPGKNLTFTLLARRLPVAPVEQFAISEAVALGVADFLRDEGIEAEVKWPNDIYVGDRKISGILIEHSLTGSSIEQTRIGVGLNVNQTDFRSDAPNPVSMRQLTGEEYVLNRVAAGVGVSLERRLNALGDADARRQMHSEFKSRLWRREGVHPFRRRGDAHEFAGVIEDVSALGPLRVSDVATGQSGEYMFKEIEFVL